MRLNKLPPHLLELNRDLIGESLVNVQVVSLPSGDDWEGLLSDRIKLFRLPEPEREYRFHPDRKWRFDFAWPGSMVACEVEGGIWVRGRHTRGKGFENDCEKYNEAVCLGWKVIRVTSGQIDNDVVIDWLMRLLGVDDER